MIGGEPAKRASKPRHGNGAVSNARTVLRLSKPIGEMSEGELSALARAAVRTFHDNLASPSTPTAPTPPWPRLFARLDTLTRPLLAAGWTVVERLKEDAG